MVWKEIPSTNKRYLVSEDGQIKSLPFIKKGNKSSYLTKEKIIKIGTDKDGYKIFVYSINSIRKSFRVHRLVAEAFIPNVKNFPIINHKDGNTGNNNKENLEWCDYSYNIIDGIRRGTIKPTNGEINGMSKLTEKKVLLIRENKILTRKELSLKYGVNIETIRKVINRISWKHI